MKLDDYAGLYGFDDLHIKLTVTERAQNLVDTLISNLYCRTYTRMSFDQACVFADKWINQNCGSIAAHYSKLYLNEVRNSDDKKRYFDNLKKICGGS